MKCCSASCPSLCGDGVAIDRKKVTERFVAWWLALTKILLTINVDWRKDPIHD